MRSKFENSLNHTDGFHDGYVKWNELSNQYESSDEDYLDVAEWMNGALAIYEKRQTEIDELTLQVAEMKSRLNDAYTDGQSAMYAARQSKVDELQYKAKLRESDHQALLVKYQATKKCWGDMSKKKDELQKRVDAVKTLIQEYRDQPTEDKTFRHALSIVADELEQALKGAE